MAHRRASTCLIIAPGIHKNIVFFSAYTSFLVKKIILKVIFLKIRCIGISNSVGSDIGNCLGSSLSLPELNIQESGD